MTPTPEQNRALFNRMTRQPHTERLDTELRARMFRLPNPSEILFVENLPAVGASTPIILPMTNPTDGVGYTDQSALPLIAPTGPSIHDVLQGTIPDCYFDVCLGGMALLRPDTVTNQVMKSGVKVRTRYIAGGVDTWMEQDALLPTNADRWGSNTWVAFYEKSYAYWRGKLNTYASLSFGNPITPFGQLGFSSIGYVPSAAWGVAATALSQNRPVAVLTKTVIAAGVPLIGNHAYVLVSVNPDGSLAFYNPWGFDGAGDGSNPDDGIVTLTQSQANANLSQVVVTTAYTLPIFPLPPTAPGDANGDGVCDFSDFTILSNNWDVSTVLGVKAGDFNGDGKVDFADFVILSNNFNDRAGALPTNFPPQEPPMPIISLKSNIGSPPKIGDVVNVSLVTDAASIEVTDLLFKMRDTIKPTSPFTFRVTAANAYTFTPIAADGTRGVSAVLLVAPEIAPPSPAADPLLFTLQVFASGKTIKI